jgi:hypothetical protein
LNTQSSATVALRALVMLVCLVVVPIAAIYGISVPDALKQPLQRYFGINIASPAAALSEAPRFMPDAPSSQASIISAETPAAANLTAGAPAPLANLAAVAAPAFPSAAAAPATLPPATSPSPLALRGAQNVVNPLGLPQGQAWDADRASSAIIPAGYQAPMDPVKPGPTAGLAGGDVSRSGFNTNQASPSAGQDPANVVPAWRLGGRTLAPAMATPAASLSDVRDGASTAMAGGGRDEGFASIQQRLRELGATYFLLESWGAQGQLYRFYCKMAIGGNANYHRYFEATGTDPIRVMSKVLKEVEAWRGGR